MIPAFDPLRKFILRAALLLCIPILPCHAQTPETPHALNIEPGKPDVCAVTSLYDGEVHKITITFSGEGVDAHADTPLGLEIDGALWAIAPAPPGGQNPGINTVIVRATTYAKTDFSAHFKVMQNKKSEPDGGAGGKSKVDGDGYANQIQIHAYAPGAGASDAALMPRATAQDVDKTYYGLLAPYETSEFTTLKLQFNSKKPGIGTNTVTLTIPPGVEIEDHGDWWPSKVWESNSFQTQTINVRSKQNIKTPQTFKLKLENTLGDAAEDSVTLLPVEIVADTNRDGLVNSSDSSGKDRWTRQRGAIYAVNLDRDGSNTHNGKPTADAITWWDSSGLAFHEDWKIDNEADKGDISPFKITIPTLPEGSKVHLALAETEDLHAIHMYPRIKAGQDAIWGACGTTGAPWTDGDGNSLDIEITEWLKPQEDEPGYDGNATGPKAGEYTFGLEGLVFRGMPVPGGTLPGGKFSGIIDLGLEIQLAGQTARIHGGKAKMKAAPFLLTPNDRPTGHVFVRDIKDGNNPVGLQAMPKSVAISSGLPGNNSQWLQDQVEIGHTQRPGGPLMKMTLVCPYENQLAEWPRPHLLQPGKGLFALGNNLGGSGGDFGGNIELSHPQQDHPLGRILAGSAISATLRAFLEAQEVQAPAVSNISYTEVEHIDEVLSPGPDGVTYVPGPAEAIALLQEKSDTEEKQIRGVLFSRDTVQPAVAKVWKSATAADTPYIITDQNYDDVIGEWSRFNGSAGGYLRFVGGTSGGQIAKLKAVSKAVQADANRIGFAGNPEGKLMIEVEHYYDTGSKASTNWKATKPNRGNAWYRKPLEGAHVVCVEKTLRWASSTPALMTVREILEDGEFLTFNQTTLPSLIAATANASGVANPVKIPCLFYMFDISNDYTSGQIDLINTPAEINSGRPWYAVAYTPNTANLQWVDSSPVNAKPFGPRNTSDDDVLEEGIQAVLPGQSSFIDNWNSFHILSGEIHCGSAAERVAEENWWTK